MKNLTNEDLENAKGRGYFQVELREVPNSLQQHCKALKVATSPYVAWRYGIKSVSFEAYYLELKVAIRELEKHKAKYSIKHKPL